jgi:riboflavin synthase
MFTGIIEDLGKVESLIRFKDRVSITISAKFLTDIKIGDSICVNGVCITVAEKIRSSFRSDVVKETLKKSALTNLNVGEFVNLERATPVNGRFEGHIVQGHVDCKSLITNILNIASTREIEVTVADEYEKYLANKGSIAVDGVSLTIASIRGNTFKVAIIPHTAIKTNLFRKKIGDYVNLEFDVIAKYLESLTKKKDLKDIFEMRDMRIDEKFLKKAGFLN